MGTKHLQSTFIIEGYPTNATRYLGNNALLGDCLGIMMVHNPLIMKTNFYILGSLPKDWFTVDSSKVRCPFTNDEQIIFPLCTPVLAEPNL